MAIEGRVIGPGVAAQVAAVRSNGFSRPISREVHFAEIDEEGNVRASGYAPYLDYERATDEQLAAIAPVLEAD